MAEIDLGFRAGGGAFEVGDIKQSARRFELGDEWALADGTLSVTAADHPELLTALQGSYALGDKYDLTEFNATASVFTPFPDLTNSPNIETTALMTRYQLLRMYTGNTTNGAALFFGGVDFRGFSAVPAFESTAQYAASGYQWYKFTPIDARYAAVLFTRNESYYDDSNNTLRNLTVGVFDSVTGEICAENTQQFYDYRNGWLVPLIYHQDEKWYYFVVTTDNSDFTTSGNSSLALYRFNFETQELELVLDGTNGASAEFRSLLYGYYNGTRYLSLNVPGSFTIIPLGGDEYYLCSQYGRVKLSRQSFGVWTVSDRWEWDALLFTTGDYGNGQPNADYDAATGIYTVVWTDRQAATRDYIMSIDMINQSATRVEMGGSTHRGNISGDYGQNKSYRLSGLDRLGGRYYLFSADQRRHQVAIHDADEDADAWPIWWASGQTGTSYTPSSKRSALITAIQGDIDVCQLVQTRNRDARTAPPTDRHDSTAPWHLLKRQSGETKVLSDLEYDATAHTLTVTITTLPPSGGGAYSDQVSVIDLDDDVLGFSNSYIGETFGVGVSADNHAMTAYLGAEGGREIIFFAAPSTEGADYDLAYIFSRDGGATWSQPERVFGKGILTPGWSAAGYTLDPINGLILASDYSQGLAYLDGQAVNIDPAQPPIAAYVLGPIFAELNYAGKYISIPKIDNHLIKVK